MGQQTGKELRRICIHEVGHAFAYARLGAKITSIVLGNPSSYCSAEYGQHKRHHIHIEALSAIAGLYFEKAYKIFDNSDPTDYYFKDVCVLVDDFPDLPLEQLKEEFEKYILQSHNNDAFSAVVLALENTPNWNGVKMMSGRRFRRIVNENGGLYAVGR